MAFFASILLALAPPINPVNAIEIASESWIETAEPDAACDVKPPSPDAEPIEAGRSAQPCNVEQWQSEILAYYPRVALRDDAQGAIRVYGLVGRDGSLKDCAVASLGNAFSLTRLACPLVKDYARFRPALDANGNAIEAPVSFRIIYVLPAWPEIQDVEIQPTARDKERWAARIAQNTPSTPVPHDLSGTVELEVLVDRNGRAAQCRVMQSSAKPITDKAACKGMLRYARFNPARDKNGAATLGVYATSIVYKTP